MKKKDQQFLDYLDSWKEEQQSSFLYEALAKKEKNNSEGRLFSQLAIEAKKQATIWEEKIKALGRAVPLSYQPDFRTRLVRKLIRHFSIRHLRTILAAMKIRGMSAYNKLLTQHPIPTHVEQIGKRHRGSGAGGNLRAAVFGINDGLVSNASLILGVAGAAHDSWWIVLSGIAGLLAGAFSMGAGEFISVTSQREMFEYQISLEKKELLAYPEQEAAELALIYQEKGLTKVDAEALAKRLIANPARALDTLAKEELGLNMEELGSPWGAAIFSFFAFAIGAFIPLLPFLVAKGTVGLYWSISITGVTLFFVGAILSLFTGRRALLSGLRMLLIGGFAGAITYLIGKLL